MKWTEELVWKAIYQVLPIEKAKEEGVKFNLPSTLNSAAVEFFIGEGTLNKEYTLDYAFASHIVREALKELNTVGYMEFGKVNKFWQ